MRDKKRIEPFLDKLEELWNEYPDYRFGQLITMIGNKVEIGDIFFPEEEKWLKGINKLLDENKNV